MREGHAKYGQEILAEMGLPEEIRLVARWHHGVNTEDFRQLIGLDESTRELIAIVAMVDIYDAMTESRPYRAGAASLEENEFVASTFPAN